MRKAVTLFAQIAILALGIAALVFLLWEPQLEGRNIHATFFQIYFNDPFLAYAYIGSIPFFVGVYQAFRLLGYMRQNRTHSLSSLQALRRIKHCAITIIGFVVIPEAYLLIARPDDDIAGGVAIGLFLIIASTVVAITAATLERTLQSTMDIRSAKEEERKG
jgi:hypothetical protein